MYAGRAQYAVTREQPGILQRFSTALAEFANDQVSATWQSTANDISFYATTTATGWDRQAGTRGAAVGLAQGTFTAAVAAGTTTQATGDAHATWALSGVKFYYSEEPILLRYHLLSPQPGKVKGPTCAPGVLPCATSTVPETFAVRQSAVSAVSAPNWVYTGGTWLPSTTMYMGVLNMRNRRVTHRVPLEDCGNNYVNVTAYEDCDISLGTSSPISAGQYNYDAAASATPYTQLTPGGRGISEYDYALGRAPAPAFWQSATRLYYQCGEICLKELAPTCPDSRQSNGKDHADLRDPLVAGTLREYCDEGPDRGLTNAAVTELWGNYVGAHSANSQKGRATAAWPLAQRREGKTAGCSPTNTCTETAGTSAPLDKHACEAVQGADLDSATVCQAVQKAAGGGAACTYTGAAGAGGSATTTDCRAITPGWECPMWGYSCNQLCGNGVVNDAAADNGDGDNARPPPGMGGLANGAVASTTGSEECDLGEYNVDL